MSSDYKRGQCGDHCHPDRYAIFTKRVGLRKRWGIEDRHLGRQLPRLEATARLADIWLSGLTHMEYLERTAKRLDAMYERRAATRRVARNFARDDA